MPRWLCVATGTASNTRAISSSVKPPSRSRSCERSITSSCAHGHAGHRRRLVLRIAGRDRDLGAAPILAVAHPLSNVRGERLRLEGGLAQDHLVDRLVDDLLEARHVRALLLGTQIDEALELRIEQLLGPVRADADDLLHA